MLPQFTFRSASREAEGLDDLVNLTIVRCNGPRQGGCGYGAGGRTPQHDEVPRIMNGKKTLLHSGSTIGLGISEEGCILPYQTVSNKRSWNEEMWQELTWHFCPTWLMDVSRLFVTSCATQQNLPPRRIKRVSNMRSGWNEETCHKHDTSVRLGRWSKRNDTSVRLFANGCTWLKTNNHFVSNYLWVNKNSYFHLSP